MNNLLDTIPKDLPITDPLLFSFIMIIEAAKLNLRIDGASSRAIDKDYMPSFQYACNNWQTIEEEDKSGVKIKYLQRTIVAAIWKQQPNPAECELVWTRYPDESETKRTNAVKYLYRFEDWRNKTFDELDYIISTLVKKNEDPVLRDGSGKKLIFPADIYDFSLQDNSVSYVYAKNATANQYFGVGATFILRSTYTNCCPKIDEGMLQKSYFESLGFIFP